MNTLTVNAESKNLPQVLEFIEEALFCAGFGPQFQVELAVEEIFVNIASYAYAPDQGDVTINLIIDDSICLTFIDGGQPYNPLLRSDPDFDLPIEEKEPGGLGVFMVKNIMDETAYEYINNQNVLSIKKALKK